MDLGRVIRQAVEAAARRARSTGPVNIASATNIDASGRTVSVYSDGDVTIIRRDGETEVIRHADDKEQDGDEDA
jgi:hypothetical protein